MKTLRYKCFKTECPVCSKIGSLQLFLNKKGKAKYARVRHGIHEKETDYNPNIKYSARFQICF